MSAIVSPTAPTAQELLIARAYLGSCRSQLIALRDTPANAERRERAERRYDAALCDVDRLERVAVGERSVA